MIPEEFVHACHNEKEGFLKTQIPKWLNSLNHFS